MLLFSSSKANFSQQRQTSFKITAFQEAAGRAALQWQQSQGQPQCRAGQGRAEQSRGGSVPSRCCLPSMKQDDKAKSLMVIKVSQNSQ